MEGKFTQQLRTAHDTNGNPRRVWLLYNGDGEVIKAEDEGYSGCPFPGVPQLPSLRVFPSEYKLWVKWGRAR